MSIAFFLLCIGLSILQAAAALPWLLAMEYRWRTRWYQPQNLGIALGICVGVGLVGGWFLSSQGPDGLARMGRINASVLHLQFAADLFVGVFWLMLTVWPKGGAVALSAFREGIRQPMFWLLSIMGLLALGITPFLPYYTFGEDLHMVREIGYAITMLLPAVFGVLAAGMSISEEIEGRTAITLMSKPVSRRQFFLGKFAGILAAALFMTVLFAWGFVWIVIFKQYYEPNAGRLPTGNWVADLPAAWLGRGNAASLLQGCFWWFHDAAVALPGLVIGFGQVMVLVAVAVALATRLPFILNLVTCLLVYFLSHLTPIMTEISKTRQGGSDALALIYFVAQLFDTLLPGLDLFDVGTAVVREVPLPMDQYSVFALYVSFYSCLYTAIALLFGLILFEDRDLA
jgi:hypothetical protein